LFGRCSSLLRGHDDTAVVGGTPDDPVAGDQLAQVGAQVAAMNAAGQRPFQRLHIDAAAEVRNDQAGLFGPQLSPFQLGVELAFAPLGPLRAFCLYLFDAPGLASCQLAFRHRGGRCPRYRLY
jgi:hypothetical protein